MRYVKTFAISMLCVAPFMGLGCGTTQTISEIQTVTKQAEVKNTLDVLEDDSSQTEITIYDVYSEQELNLLFGVVEAETTGCEFDVKCNVVSVIFNRVASPKFKQNTVTDVLLAPNQFSVVKSGKYKTIPVTQDTVDAVKYVYTYGDTAAGAIFFETMKSNVHGSYATYVFNDGRHKFYT